MFFHIIFLFFVLVFIFSFWFSFFSFFTCLCHFWRFETFTGKPHLDETSKNRGKWKKTKKWTKNEKNWKKTTRVFFIFGGLKPSLANLIWTKPAKTVPNEKKTKKMKKKEKKWKNKKELEYFSFLEVWNLHWQTSFGRNQQKPRQMKKKRKKWTKNEKNWKNKKELEFFFIFGGLKPSLANLIWTKPAKTEANEKKNEKMNKKRKKLKK